MGVPVKVARGVPEGQSQRPKRINFYLSHKINPFTQCIFLHSGYYFARAHGVKLAFSLVITAVSGTDETSEGPNQRDETLMCN